MPLQLTALLPGLVIFALLLAIVLGLALYRMMVARHEDFHIHASFEEAPAVGQQIAVAERLNWVDRWGKSLTAITLVYFLLLLCLVLYQLWQQQLDHL